MDKQTFSTDTPCTPIDITADLPRAAEGLAEGTVTVTLDLSAPADKVLLYWGDMSGKPLDGYGFLSRTRPAGYADGTRTNPTVLTLPTGLIIPQGAAFLLARTEYAGAESDDMALPLPEDAVPFAVGRPLVQFQVPSDLHIDDDFTHLYAAASKQHAEMMLKDVAENCPETLGIMVAGDIADRGKPEQYELMRQIIDQTPKAPPLWCVMGNHDYYFGEAATQIEQFKAFAGNDSLWYDKWLGGYHFIFITCDYGGCRVNLPEEEVAWLREKLDENADPNRPAFVFCHQSVMNTVAGSSREEDWWGLVNGDEIGAILAAHPEAVFFNGHSHWELASDHEYYPADERLCHGFNTASVSYLWTGLDVVGGEYLFGSEGLYVTVCDNGITLVRGRDFIGQKWIAAAQYAVRHTEK